jgi:hypothetical protein
MANQEGIVKGDPIQKFSSAAFIIGGVFVVVFNIIVPRPADPSDMQVALTNMAENFFMFQFGHLMLALGLWGVMVGVVGVRSVIKRRGSAWAQAGFYGIVLGTTLWMITYAMTSVEAREAAAWALTSSAEREVLFNTTVATIHVGSAAYIMSILFYWLALLFLGVGIARSRVYPAWLGWSLVGIALSMVTIVGIPQFLKGDVVLSSMLIFAGLAGLTSLWFVVIGIWVARKAW